MDNNSKTKRSLGLLEATGVGVGAIVGGGIFALAGVAFASTGPSAIVAFMLNGIIAILTALTFAEMSTKFPESGGTYTFAKKVLSVQTAFMVGWIVWFASIVAGVLYALGFASFGVIALEYLWRAFLGTPPHWIIKQQTVIIFAVGAIVFYSFSLSRKSSGGGQWVTIGKLVMFAILIIGGLWAIINRPSEIIYVNLTPFFPGGALGLFQAMGYTFIALQGFDLIAAVAGEIRNPNHTIPRAMLLSLGIALVIYLPLLFIIATVGVESGQSIAALSAEHTETLIAVAVQNYLGPIGFWFVIVAAILSMLSALHANLFAASRVALTMARDRTLPNLLGGINKHHGTPTTAIMATTFTIIMILLIIPNVAAAGAAASLIFLISFALVHLTSILAHRRGSAKQDSFRLPWFPLIPTIGGLACLSLAIFQGISVPSAGLIATVWLGFGGILYLALFAQRARVVDASAEAIDPQLVRLRGRSPLVLVPIANPANAEALIAVANALAPPNVGRVLLLSVVATPNKWQPGKSPQTLLDSQAALRRAFNASFTAGLSPEALTTVAPRPWAEIIRISRTYRCESLLLGLSNFTDQAMEHPLEKLMSSVDCDVVILRAPQGWKLSEAQRIFVPVGGRGDQSNLRARLLGSLCRTAGREITFLRVFPTHRSKESFKKARRDLSRLARDEVYGSFQAKVIQSNNIAEDVTQHALESDLVILGLKRLGRRHTLFGEVTRQIANNTKCAMIMIARRG